MTDILASLLNQLSDSINAWGSALNEEEFVVSVREKLEAVKLYLRVNSSVYNLILINPETLTNLENSNTEVTEVCLKFTELDSEEIREFLQGINEVVQEFTFPAAVSFSAVLPCAVIHSSPFTLSLQCLQSLPRPEIRSEIRSVYEANVQSLQRVRDNVFAAVFERYTPGSQKLKSEVRKALESVYSDVVREDPFTFTKIITKVWDVTCLCTFGYSPEIAVPNAEGA